MSTMSIIAVTHGDIIKFVTLHFDGYLRGAGKTLYENYNSAKANELVSMGNVCSLGREIGTEHEFDDMSESQCTFYSRDRGEPRKWSVANTIRDIVVEFEYVNHFYIMKNDTWYYTDGKSEFRPLGEVLTMLYLRNLY